MKRAAWVIVGVLALAGCGTTATVTVTAPPPSSWSAQTATVNGCRALAAWEVGPSTGSEADAHTSMQVQAIITQSAGTQFSSDLKTWVDDSYPQTMTDAQVVDNDCAAAGVPDVIGSG